MAKNFINDIASFAIKYRAVCRDSDFVGPWRETESEALDDTDGHQTANPSHQMDIEVKQTQTMLVGINNFK